LPRHSKIEKESVKSINCNSFPLSVAVQIAIATGKQSVIHNGCVHILPARHSKQDLSSPEDTDTTTIDDESEDCNFEIDTSDVHNEDFNVSDDIISNIFHNLVIEYAKRILIKVSPANVDRYHCFDHESFIGYFKDKTLLMRTILASFSTKPFIDP